MMRPRHEEHEPVNDSQYEDDESGDRAQGSSSKAPEGDSNRNANNREDGPA